MHNWDFLLRLSFWVSGGCLGRFLLKLNFISPTNAPVPDHVSMSYVRADVKLISPRHTDAIMVAILIFKTPAMHYFFQSIVLVLDWRTIPTLINWCKRFKPRRSPPWTRFSYGNKAYNLHFDVVILLSCKKITSRQYS
jgi:hypothetical protein